MYCVSTIAILAFLLLSCSLLTDDEEGGNGDLNGQTSDKHYDVYVAGYEVNTASKGSFVAKVWKNGKETILSDGNFDASAYSVFVSGNDVYASGYEKNEQGKFIARLWINGTPTDLTDGSNNATARSVLVSGGDLYILGSEQNAEGNYVGIIWKNYNATSFTDGTKSRAYRSLFVSGNDVYVSGNEVNEQDNRVATYWKNGVVTYLTDGLRNAEAHSIFVSGNDVYVAGSQQRDDARWYATLWKNGVPTQLANTSSIAQSVSVSGNDVYVAGYGAVGGLWATVWKNGVATELDNKHYSSVAYSIVTSGSDFFVTGSISSPQKRDYCKVWRNNETTFLTAGHEYTSGFSIFVVETTNPPEPDDTDISENWDIAKLDVARNVDYLSDVEKDVMLEMNKARTDPRKYAAMYIRPMMKDYKYNKKDLDECIQVMSLMPKSDILTIARGLSLAAKDHTTDLGKTGNMSHTGSDGSTPDQRMARYGRGQRTWGENIDFGRSAARDIVIALLIDDDIPSRGHRLNIMNSQFCQAGVSVAPHPKYGQHCVIVYACGYVNNL